MYLKKFEYRLEKSKDYRDNTKESLVYLKIDYDRDYKRNISFIHLKKIKRSNIDERKKA